MELPSIAIVIDLQQHGWSRISLSYFAVESTGALAPNHHEMKSFLREIARSTFADDLAVLGSVTRSLQVNNSLKRCETKITALCARTARPHHPVQTLDFFRTQRGP